MKERAELSGDLAEEGCFDRSEVSHAVEDTAYPHGYSVMLCNTDESPDKEELYLNLMQDTNVAGVIFAPTRQTIARFAALNLAFPSVLVDRTLALYEELRREERR